MYFPKKYIVKMDNCIVGSFGIVLEKLSELHKKRA